MDKSDGVGKESDKSDEKKSGTLEDGGKVNKNCLVGTFNFNCY